MSAIIETLLNYALVIIKTIIFSAVIAIPFVFITLLGKDLFDHLYFKKKNSYLFSMFILVYGLLFIVLLLVYFLPIIFQGIGLPPVNSIIFVILQVFRLIIVNILITGILLVFILVCTAIYDSISKTDIKKKSKAKQLNILNLWFSLIIIILIIFALLIIFPKLIAMLIYLIFM